MPRLLTFQDALRNGIRPDSRTPSDAQYLSTCTNLRATPFGLKDFITVNQPITAGTLTAAGVTPTWPFPQLFRGKSVTLLCDEAAIFEVDESTWSLTPILPLDFRYSGAQRPVVAGGPWHFLDLYDTWMLFNGACVVFKTPFNSTPFCQTDVTIQTGCELWEGRVFFGGFNSSDFYRMVDWPTFLATYEANIPSNISAETLTSGAGENWVWWSTVGGGDLWWLFSLYYMLYGWWQNPALDNETLTAGDMSSGTPWTLGGAQSIGSGVGSSSGSGYFSQGSADQVSGEELQTGEYYLVQYTVSNRLTGGVYAQLGNDASYAGQTRSADGTYLEVLKCVGTDTFVLYCSNFTGDVDDISVKRLDWSGLTWNTGYDSSNYYFLDLLKRNQSGLRPMPWRGNVMHMRPLGRGLAVYGESGTALLRHTNEYISTFSMFPLYGWGRNLGIASRSAVAGDERHHVALDESGELWHLTSEGQAERLGYGQLLSGFLGEDVVFSHDGQRDEFYLADGTDCYVLSKSGLSKAPWLPTTVSFASGGVIGITFDAAETSAAEVVTVKFYGDDVQSISELHTVMLRTADTDATGWSVAVDYRYDKGDSWTRTTAVETDGRGVAHVNVTGREFRVVLTHPDRTKCDLDGVDVVLRTAEGRRLLAP